MPSCVPKILEYTHLQTQKKEWLQIRTLTGKVQPKQKKQQQKGKANNFFT